MPEPISKTQEEILILAGDIGDSYSEAYSRFLIEQKKIFEHVILVPGNHEYYTDGKRDMNVVKEHLLRLSSEIGFTLLDNSSKVINGKRFIGSTSWPLVPEEQFKALQREGYGLATRISRDSHVMDFSDFTRLHNEDVEFLKTAVEQSKEPCIIITHYPPSSYMLDDKYEHSPYVKLHYNRGLIEDVAKIDNKTPLWLCGHCHNSKRFWMKNMNILLAANCFLGGQYDPDFCISV